MNIKKTAVSNLKYALILTFFFVLIANKPFWMHFLEATSSTDAWAFKASFFLIISIVTLLSIYIFTWKRIYKPLSILILLSSSFSLYFMSTYGIVIDKSMIQNALETDPAETLDLLNLNLLRFVLIYGLLPIFVIYFIQLKEQTLKKELKFRFSALILSTIIVACLIAPFSKEYLALARNHRELRYLYNPSNYIYSITSIISKTLKNRHKDRIPVAEDAQRTSKESSNARKKVFLLVIGETARAANFSLNGYSRETNPYLSKEDIISFTKTYSCGTSTSVSIPCIFSHLGKDHGGDQQKAKDYDNLLDVLSRAGVKTIWRENNSGCKGVCDRTENDPVASTGPETLCKEGKCQDEVLLSNLESRMDSLESDTLIILHTQGSHGPAYYKRYPDEFRKFSPTCDTSNIEECTQEQIINSYDNSILYTDYFLSKLLEILKKTSNKHDTGMLYVSDHGESLGENNIYLHGSPYYLAPDSQIHIPLIIWLSESYQKNTKVTKACLEKNRELEISHDYIYQSMLGIFNVQTKIYNPNLDLFSKSRCE